MPSSRSTSATTRATFPSRSPTSMTAASTRCWWRWNGCCDCRSSAAVKARCATCSTCRRWPRVSAWAKRTDRKSTRLNSSHITISYAVFCLKKKKKKNTNKKKKKKKKKKNKKKKKTKKEK